MANPPDNTYKEAWVILYNCLGERIQHEEMELMDAVLQCTIAYHKELEDALQDKTTEPVS